MEGITADEAVAAVGTGNPALRAFRIKEQVRFRLVVVDFGRFSVQLHQFPPGSREAVGHRRGVHDPVRQDHNVGVSGMHHEGPRGGEQGRSAARNGGFQFIAHAGGIRGGAGDAEGQRDIAAFRGRAFLGDQHTPVTRFAMQGDGQFRIRRQGHTFAVGHHARQRNRRFGLGSRLLRRGAAAEDDGCKNGQQHVRKARRA